MAGSIRGSGDFTGTNWGFLPLHPGQLASESSLSFLRSGFSAELAGLAHLAGPEEFTGFKTFSSGISCATLTQGASDFHYFGDSGTDGSWRIGRSGNNLVHERRESGSWVTKMTVEA